MVSQKARTLPVNMDRDTLTKLIEKESKQTAMIK